MINSPQKAKIIFAAFFTLLNGFLWALAVPFYILVGANIADYITGIAACICQNQQITSAKGFKGIVKKIAMWFLVAIGFALDYCIFYFGSIFGITVSQSCLIAVAVVFWLVANELISILENISDIGTPMPRFLLTIANLLKEKTENTILPKEEK